MISTVALLSIGRLVNPLRDRLVEQFSNAEGEEDSGSEVDNLFLWLESQDQRVTRFDQQTLSRIIERVVQVDPNRQLTVSGDSS